MKNVHLSKIRQDRSGIVMIMTQAAAIGGDMTAACVNENRAVRFS